MTILQQAWNWKFIKYLQEAFKASQLIFTGTRVVCALHKGVCVSQRQKIHLGRLFLSQRSSWLAKPSLLPVPPKKEDPKAGSATFQG